MVVFANIPICRKISSLFEIFFFDKLSSNKTNIDKRRCYYFRIRTELDKSGNVTRALYGKIYGDFQLIGDGKKINDIKFLYYLNPTLNERNLEWDMKSNLCPTQERIRNPQP